MRTTLSVKVLILCFVELSLLSSVSIACGRDGTKMTPLTNSSIFQKRSTKKGIVLAQNSAICHDFDAFSTISWWYNYHTYENLTDVLPEWCSCPDGKSNGDPTCFPSNPDDVVFVPIIWGVPGHGHRWKNFSDPDVAEDMDTVLGYNEPNREDQSDIPPDEAAVLWSELTQKYNDKILVSPATAGINKPWMDTFMAECDLLDCRIDYIATHKYFRPGEEEAVLKDLKAFSERYGGRKIWLTEFAVEHTTNEEEIIEVIENFLPRLEEADYIWRYSWFVHRYNPVPPDETTNWWLDPINSLTEFDSPKLTRVGEAYDKPWHSM